MTHRERVIAALNHQEPDRVPIDLSGHRSSGIAGMAYHRLRAALGLQPKPVRIYDPVQQIAIVHDDVLDRFGVDTIELGRAFAHEDGYWVDWTLPDGAPCQMPAWSAPEREEKRWVIKSPTGRVIAQMPDGAWYFEQTYWPFFEEDDDPERLPELLDECMWTGLASPPGPIVAGEEGGAVFRAGARQLREQSERAILGLFGGNLHEFGQFFYRIDKWLMMLAGEPDRVNRFLDKVVEMHLAALEQFLGAVGKHIDVILFGDDLGMQSGPQMSPAMYRDIFKPRHALLWRRAKELADVKVMLHCCGGVRELLPDLIDAGLDAINPVQISCNGMEAAALKRDFGGQMVFWGGGCDTQDILPNGTPEQVAKHTREQVAHLKRGGGFVFQQVHNILANVPAKNIIAMFDAIHEA